MVTTITVPEETRDHLRRYKAKHGDTYGEAIIRLLENDGWLKEAEA